MGAFTVHIIGAAGPQHRKSRPGQNDPTARGGAARELLVWRFIATEDTGTIWWEWEARTQTGEIVRRSSRRFIHFTDCEWDAKESGYIEPENRPS